jgi:hypothetical protein
MFWYNPYQGVIRTRVPPAISDQRSLDLYNRLNRCNLSSIFPTERDSPAPADPHADTNATVDQDAESSPLNAPAPTSKPNASRG